MLLFNARERQVLGHTIEAANVADERGAVLAIVERNDRGPPITVIRLDDWKFRLVSDCQAAWSAETRR